MTLRMRDIKEQARKRRAKLLAQFNKKDGWTITEFAEFHGMTRARMSKILSIAKREA